MARHKLLGPGQFETREGGEFGPVYMVHGQQKIYGEVVCWTLEVPEEVAQDGFAVFVPGYGGIKTSSRAIRRASAESGKPMLTYAPCRNDNRSLLHNLRLPQEVHTETLARVVDDARDRIRDIDDLPHQQSLLDGGLELDPHSMGEPAATRYALDNSDRVDQVNFLGCIGLGSPTLASLAETVTDNGMWSLRNELLPLASKGQLTPAHTMLMRFIRHMIKNPGRTAGEGLSCLMLDDRANVAALSATNVTTTYTRFSSDCLVSPTIDIDGIVDMTTTMDGYGHLAPQVHPRAVIRHLGRIGSSTEPLALAA